MKRILVILLLVSMGFTRELMPVVKTYDDDTSKKINYYDRVEEKEEKWISSYLMPSLGLGPVVIIVLGPIPILTIFFVNSFK